MTVPPRTWGYYARFAWERQQRTGPRVYDRKAFEESVAVDGMRRLSEQAERWLAMFDVDERRLAAALVDGHAPRYVQRREEQG